MNHLCTMNRFALILALLLGVTFHAVGQTGNGVVLLTNPTYTFTPTTVDSTTVFNFQLQNTVGIAQIVYFGGLSGPFALADNNPVEVPSQGVVDLSLNFTPPAVGAFSDTLEVIGSIFGSANLVVSGNGIQVVLSWESYQASFETTAIGATSFVDIPVTNVGDGTATITSMGSNSGVFDVEFVDDWVDPGMPEPCATYNGVNYYPFTLSIQPSNTSLVNGQNFNASFYIDDWDQIDGNGGESSYLAFTMDGWTGGQWYVDDNGNEFSDYFNVGTTFEMCLPVSSESGLGFYWYVHDDYCDFSGVELTLTDAYGNIAWQYLDWDGISGNWCDWGADYEGQPSLEVTIPSASAFVAGSLEEGETQIARISFSPTDAGSISDQVFVTTNSPLEPMVEIECSGNGVSEVSGEVCDITWTSLNSPYTLVGDVVVPEGCTLNIDPGVEVIGNDYDIEVFGAFFANGEEGNEVQIEVGELLSHTASENMVLIHSIVLETNEFEFPDLDFRRIRDNSENNSTALPLYLQSENALESFFLYNNENADSHWGKYLEDFSDNDCQGWELTYDSWSCPSNISQTCDGSSLNRVYDNCNSSNWGWIRTLSPTFTMNSGESPSNVSFVMNTHNDNWGYNSNYIDYNIAYRVNGESWVNLENSGGYLAWELRSFDLSSLNEVETIQFRMSGHFLYRGVLNIDDFVITTNFYPGEDVPVPAAVAAAAVSLSTGGIQLIGSAYNGDFHSVGDSIDVVLENSAILVNVARDKDSHGLGLYADHVNLSTNNSTVSGHGLDGIHIESLTTAWADQNGLVEDSGEDGVAVSGGLHLEATELDVIGNGADGLDVGENSNLTIHGARIQGNGGHAIGALVGSVIDLDYVLMDDNGGRGVELGAGGALSLSNCRLRGNGAEGIRSESPVTINHCDIAFSGGTGLVLTGNNFHTLNNSILWGNNSSNYTQIDIGGGVISTSYSTVQGRSSYGTTGSGQYYWGEGVIEADPLFADDDLHLEIFSPCVDGGQPWHQDAYMPFGLGGVRADMGMYGGPDNAYWGGEALPDGASSVTSVSDSPQDQGNVVGLTFGASFYDNSDLVNNVTSYAFWRHYDPTGAPISTLDEGSWELIGEMPAQSFNGYAYQAPTLGNTNAFGEFHSCYTVVAHTDDPDTYWYSNVMCGESVDNLAPAEPELDGMILADGGAQISWPEPMEEDYAFTEVFNDAGFNATVGTDTLVVDAAASPGQTYTYTAIHYDVNGNASEPASLTLEVAAGSDAIALKAGWNLISVDRALDGAPVGEVFGGLATENLQYVTGFQNGVQFYNPNGLSFLNTLSTLDDGYGYWVKVAEDDLLEVTGASLPDGFRPPLAAGWNLIGYPNDAPSDPAAYFADLIADENLVYVTGFDEGAQVFDPNGLAFLNTLTALENGFGYWVKTVSGDDPNGLAPTNEKANPNYMVLNGRSDLAHAAGSTVSVLAPSGETVASLPILDGGYLMTTALFGADPSSTAAWGLAPGDELRFAFDGKLADQTLSYEGAMAHKALDLTFTDSAAALTVWPNPARSTIQVQFDLPTATVAASLVIRDLAGRVVLTKPLGGLSTGQHVHDVGLTGLSAGAYELSLLIESSVVGAQRLMIAK